MYFDFGVETKASLIELITGLNQAGIDNVEYEYYCLELQQDVKVVLMDCINYWSLVIIEFHNRCKDVWKIHKENMTFEYLYTE